MRARAKGTAGKEGEVEGRVRTAEGAKNAVREGRRLRAVRCAGFLLDLYRGAEACKAATHS